MSSVRGSVITPVSADAAAVSGLQSKHASSLVPDRPGKLRGTVRRLLRPRRGRLAHADAAVAARLVQACAGVDQIIQPACPASALQQLPRCRIDVEGHPSAPRAAPNHLSRNGKITITGIGRRADISLVNRRPSNFTYRDNRCPGCWAWRSSAQGRKVDLLVMVIIGVRVGGELAPFLRVPAPQEPAHRLVGGKTVVVAPSSAPMLAMTWRSMAVSDSSPGP